VAIYYVSLFGAILFGVAGQIAPKSGAEGFANRGGIGRSRAGFSGTGEGS